MQYVLGDESMNRSKKVSARLICILFWTLVIAMTHSVAAARVSATTQNSNKDMEATFQDISFDAALAAAKQSGKVVMIDFFTTWCGPCKMLDETTWKDGKVVAWLREKTIALRIDAEKEVELSSKYHVDAYPTILFIKPDGTEIDRLVGYRNSDALLSEAEAALSGKDSVARAKEKIPEDKKNDPMLRMPYADALAQKGKYEEALVEYLWCFDHGLEYNQSFVGVRGSFLLSN